MSILLDSGGVGLEGRVQLPFKVANGRWVSLVIRFETSDFVDGDGIGAVSVEKEFSRSEKAVGAVQTQYIDGRLAEAGDFQRPGLQGTEPAVPAARAFRKDEQVATAGEEGGHGLQAFEKEPGMTALAGGGKVSRAFDHRPENGGGEEARFDDGAVLGKEGDEKERVEIGEVVADHHRRADVGQARIDDYFLAAGDTPQQKEENPKKVMVESLKPLLRFFAHEVDRQIGPGKDKEKAAEEPGPAEQGDTEAE